MGEDHPNSKRILVLETIRTMTLAGEPITNLKIQERSGVGRETVRTYLQALYENKYLKKDNGCFECPNPNALLTFTNEDRPYRRQKSRTPKATKGFGPVFRSSASGKNIRRPTVLCYGAGRSSNFS